MQLYINDLSYLPAKVIQDKESVIKDFVNVCQRLRTFSFEKMVMPDDFKTKELGQSFSFISFMDSLPNSNLYKQRLRSIIANQMSKISSNEVNEIEELIQYVEYKGEDSLFFKYSLNNDMPLISFRTDNSFDCNQFDVVNKYLDETEKEITNSEVVLNISCSTHFDVHQSFLNKKQFENSELNGRWNPKTEPLRYTEKIEQYLNDFNYDNKLEAADENTKMSLYLKVGTDIAEMNGWIHKKRLSAKNSTADKKRKIFKSLNQSVYLSIDFRHGTFELLDRRGKHITEYNFRGEDLGNTDDDTGHNIIL